MKNQIKKIGLIVAILITNLGFSQEGKIRDVVNYMESGEVAAAKNRIDQIFKNPSTSNSPNMWVWRGIVYASILGGTDEELKTSAPDAFDIMFESYKNFYSFPAGGRGKYEEQADQYAPYVVGLIFNKGIEFYDKKGKYQETKKYMEVAYSLVDAVKIDWSKDNISLEKILYIQSKSAQLDSLTDEELTLLNKIIQNPKYLKADVYSRISEIYTGQKNYEKAIEVLNLGKDRIPAEANEFFKSEINIEIERNNFEVLLQKFTEGIANEPTNAMYYANRAYVTHTLREKEKKSNVDKFKYNYLSALNDYKKALELEDKPDYHINMAALLVDSANFAYANRYSSKDEKIATAAAMNTLKLAYEKCEYIYNNGFVSGSSLVDLLKTLRGLSAKLQDDTNKKRWNELYNKEIEKNKEY